MDVLTKQPPGYEAHIFRNPELGIKEERAFLRSERGPTFPVGKQGFVVEDLDIVLRWYATGHCQCEYWQPHPCADCQGLDSVGRLRLIEVKYRPNGVALLRPAQKYTFGLLDSMIGDQERYDGFYVVAHQQPTLGQDAAFTVNSRPLDALTFRRWCLTAQSWIPRHPPELASL